MFNAVEEKEGVSNGNFETLGDCDSPVSKFETVTWAFFYTPAWDFTCKKSEPETLGAKNFEVMVKIKLNKMHDRKCEWKLEEAHQYSALAKASCAPLSEKLKSPTMAIY